MAKLYNRAKMTVTTSGTNSPVTLGSAVAGYQSFASAGVQSGDVVSYCIEDGASFEYGVGTYSSTGPTLTRTLGQSSTGSLLNLSGSATVFIGARAEDIPNPLTQMTALTASGNPTRDFTGIPTGVKRITVIFNGVSSSGTASILLQLGVGSTPTTSGYTGGVSVIVYGVGNVSTGPPLGNGVPVFNNNIAMTLTGAIIFTNITGNTWVASGTLSDTANNGNVMVAGAIALGGALGMVRVSGNGSNFDAGTINVLYE